MNGNHNNHENNHAVRQATVVLGAQWGDEGKGKLVDLLAAGADVVCRCQVSPSAAVPPLSQGLPGPTVAADIWRPICETREIRSRCVIRAQPSVPRKLFGYSRASSRIFARFFLRLCKYL